MSLEPTLNAAFDCCDLERSIDAYLDDEFDARERADFDAHLAGCTRCREHVDAQRRLRSAVKAKLREAMMPPSFAGRAPPELRARIEHALARGRRPLWRRLLAPVPVATLAACAAGALVVLAMHGPDDALLQDAVNKHHRALPLEIHTASVGESSISEWFIGKLDFNPAPPRFETDGVQLLGARLSNVREWPAAYIRYALPKGQAGLFIVDDPERRFDATGREVRVGGTVIRLTSSAGYNVATWREDEIVYSLVADLDEVALEALVRTARSKARP